MIPEQLRLKNFLSYREAILDFRGLQTACICGPNGAGKSSLLEAIAWALWGQSRAASEDDAIHAGEREAQVDFIFRLGGEVYRVVRTRRLRQSATLEFQVAAGDSDPAVRQFRSLTEKGVRATQKAINRRLRLDYDTFTNSAYLRQGRADEFMLRRPAERKQILADLLKLSQYDELADRARDRTKQLKGEMAQLERSLETMATELANRGALAREESTLQAQIAAQRDRQAHLSAELERHQGIQIQRQTWQQEQAWQQQQLVSLDREIAQADADLLDLARQTQQITAILEQADEIETQLQRLQAMQQEDDRLAAQAVEHARLRDRRQTLQRQLDQQLAQLRSDRQQVVTQQDNLRHQLQDQDAILAQTAEVETALAQLQQAQANLEQIEQQQAQVAPLRQQQQDLLRQRVEVVTRLQARREELTANQQRLRQELAQLPTWEAQLQTLSAQIAALKHLQVQQEEVKEAGLERKSAIARLEALQADAEAQLGEVQEKAQLLQSRSPRTVKPPSSETGHDSGYGDCPLCDRPLNAEHWQTVWAKNTQQQQEIRDRLRALADQQGIAEQERARLRAQFAQLKRELAPLAELEQQHLHLTLQCQELQGRSGELAPGERELATLAATIAYLQAPPNQRPAPPEPLPAIAQPWIAKGQTLDHLTAQIAELADDEGDRTQARREVERWRWAEIRHNEIQQAQRRREQLIQQQPELAQRQTDLDQAIATLTDAHNATALPAQIADLDRQIADLDYSLDRHNTLRADLRDQQRWLTRGEALRHSQAQLPQLTDRQQERQATRDRLQGDRQACQAQLTDLAGHLAATPDPNATIRDLEAQLARDRQDLETHLAQLGRIQQQRQHLDELAAQSQREGDRLTVVQRDLRIHQELAQAFGKNGIQALAIETLLPQLEAEANRILARLSANQLHVQFVTQRAKKSQPRRRKGKANTSDDDGVATIETLDIKIGNAQGTRPYETYSGGEAFRINFAIRLALARLLAQRSGTALQLLIVDEGFGTQDAAGCDRLIAAINAIADDFACILAVTHIPHLKEAFHAHIEVSKTQDGSQLLIAG